MNRRRRALRCGLLVLLVLLAWSTLAGAAPVYDPTPLAYRSAAEEARFHALTAELRCVQCQNQSLADSHAQIAMDLRREVLELMQQGRSDAQIKQFLVARYGEFVLYRPQLEARTWLLWFGPLTLLGAGTLLLARLVRRRTTAANAAPLQDQQEW
ncbi:cytochrome c-type biogenesis protein CcmH [Xanthomonas albilineans]|uniref:Cytochrome c-type biogenesis protein n=1 Tax=Xanthomonas albilineans (strain GPE PC73 / CFBP 7063) TaxID=380358 RepID=D2UCX2_XANAP|nr:cytochrome c-type biogenesis protein [Xanthomonas albilineans]QHQ28016.1 putative c-type cytochrome biogenesis protein ccmh [Xanthomonas albilineans]CBA15798.1 probable c-type cytochrome biogenesis protein ccmh [Xanthomonas albilineans GPE PC73]